MEIKNEQQKVCKLNREIYGLIQASKNFYMTLSTFFIEHGFKKRNSKPCLFIKTTNELPIILGIYVDDILMIGDSKQIKQEITTINELFNIRVKASINYFVGCQIKLDKNQIILHQEIIINDLIETFYSEIIKMRNINSPMTSNTHVIRPEIDDDNVLTPKEQTRYQSGVGSLLYIIKHSIPDLSNSFRELTKAMYRESQENYKQLIHVLKFLKITKQLGIKF